MRLPPALHHAGSLLCPRLTWNLILSCLSALPRLPQGSVCFSRLTRTSRSRPGLFPPPVLSHFSCSRRSQPWWGPRAGSSQNPSDAGEVRPVGNPCSPCPGVRDAELLHPGQGGEGSCRGILRAGSGQEVPGGSGWGAEGFGPGPSEKPCLSKAPAPGVTSAFREPERKHSTKSQTTELSCLPAAEGEELRGSSSHRAGWVLGGGRGVQGWSWDDPPLPFFTPNCSVPHAWPWSWHCLPHAAGTASSPLARTLPPGPL